MDFSMGGSMEDFDGQVKVDELTLGKLKRHLSSVVGKVSSAGASIVLVGDGNEFMFKLCSRESYVLFSVSNRGARGSFLNVQWNPTKFMTGQNVFRSKTSPNDTITLAGVEGFRVRPAEVTEFPFKWLKLFLDEVSGKWPGKGMVTKAIEDRTIYWRRLDFTTYTLPFSTDSRKQSCLEMLAFMATAKTVWGFDPKCPGMSKEMGLQKFAGAKVDVYKAQSGDVDVYGTVAFTKMCHDRPAFRLSIYDKKKEVESCGDKNNQKVIAGGEIDLRLRLELQLMPEAFRRLPSLRVGAADRDDFAQTSFLHDAFSTDFDQLVCGLLIESMRLLKLDWILLPRDPDLLLNRVAQMMEDPESSVEDGDVAMVVTAWKDNRGPLPGSDRVTEKDHPLFGKMSRARASRAYAAVQHACGLDVVKMRYAEITFLWNLLLEAHIPYEERIRLEEAKRRLAAGTMSKEVFSALSQRLYSSARRLAVDSRKDYRQVLGQGQIRQNLRDV